ncbi:YegP family protein [Sinomicrobium kalidii]|uniref:YegP family protein n=1 Tax=Sinomicrobium kalidii TaxID=2900738 RepID=UPI001E52AC24|nr:YegP family protein [Sinomicrobium kalidii]UGU17225.1 YegP family protein [Sinomicrobium kalidii]
MGVFVISKQTNGDYKFVFTSRKGKAIFTSISFKRKSDCEQVIERVIDDIEMFTFTKKHTASGKYFFRLSKGGLVLATSRKYSTELSLGRGVDGIMKYVLGAEVLDFSENESVFPESETASAEKE